MVMSLTLRHRLGLTPTDVMPMLCACGEVLADVSNPYHFHSCTYHRRRTVTNRHDQLAKLFQSLCRARATVLLEDHWRYHDRPDLEIFFNAGPNNGHVLADVSIVCPCAPSYRVRASTSLACAEYRAETKRNRYVDLANSMGADNQPLVFESLGGSSTSTRTVLARLFASYASQPSPEVPLKVWANLVRQRISICLQRGNAFVDRAGITQAVRASRGL